MANFFFPRTTIDFNPQPFSNFLSNPFDIKPGFMLVPHSHPNSDEIVQCLSGKGQVHLIVDDPSKPITQLGTALHKIEDFKRGDFIFLPRGSVHFFLNPTISITNQEEPAILRLQSSFENANPDILLLSEVLNLLPSGPQNGVLEAVLKAQPFEPIVQYKQLLPNQTKG